MSDSVGAPGILVKKLKLLAGMCFTKIEGLFSTIFSGSVEIGRFSKKDDKSWIMRSVEDELEHRRSMN